MLFTAIIDPLYLLDLERSQKGELGMCRSHIAALRRKRFTTRPNWGVNDYLLIENYIRVHQDYVLAAVGHGDVPGTKSNHETCTVFDVLSH